MVENSKGNACDSVRKIEAYLTKLMSLFGVFISENQARSKLFTFTDRIHCSTANHKITGTRKPS